MSGSFRLKPSQNLNFRVRSPFEEVLVEAYRRQRGLKSLRSVVMDALENAVILSGRQSDILRIVKELAANLPKEKKDEVLTVVEQLSWLQGASTEKLSSDEDTLFPGVATGSFESVFSGD